jgi:CheY-like chemotaxis protein
MGIILVVDDEKSIRITFREFLMGDGHEVEVAATADEAVPLLKARDFDVVITDIIMPRVTGVDFRKFNIINNLGSVWYSKLFQVPKTSNMDNYC